ncbi:MAG: hypothetical protein ACREQD_09800, partial [Candidatus Binataceae bacterium]
MTLRRTNLIGWAVVCVVAFFAAGGAAQQPTLGPAPTTHVPIALPIEAPSGFDPVAWATFRQRCQEVADMSAANLPMGSGDYGYADACTKQGAYFHPVKQRPKPPAVPTVTVTPGPDGHIPLDLPSSPPPRSSYYRQPDVWARILRMCQEVADRQYQNQPVDHSA